MAWPTTSDPRTQFVTLRFTVAEADDIDWLTAVTGATSRSAALRDAVDRAVEAQKRKHRSKRRSTADLKGASTDE